MKTIILCGFLAALALVFVPPERSVAKQTEDVVLLIEEPARRQRCPQRRVRTSQRHARYS